MYLSLSLSLPPKTLIENSGSKIVIRTWLEDPQWIIPDSHQSLHTHRGPKPFSYHLPVGAAAGHWSPRLGRRRAPPIAPPDYCNQPMAGQLVGPVPIGRLWLRISAEEEVMCDDGAAEDGGMIYTPVLLIKGALCKGVYVRSSSLAC